MSFLQTIFDRCQQAPDRPVVQEVRDGTVVPATGSDLLDEVKRARTFLNKAGLKKGERCALVASNSIRWAALDLAIIAEGGVVVPLYARQAVSELVEMMKDCSPSLICCGDERLREAIAEHWPEAPRCYLFHEVFAAVADNDLTVGVAPQPVADNDAVTIIYTSGTSGEAKGVILTAGNLNYMLGRTAGRLDMLMRGQSRAGAQSPDRVFHYLPFCFCGSWILLLTCLSRNSLLTISTDLNKLGDELKVASPDYFLNVPALLERMRAGIEGQFRQWGGARERLFEKGR
jgi:long-chain acyl-CoA synthetase